MNVKAGEVAWITREPYRGHFVTVLRWSAPGKDVLPDGFPANNTHGGGWMVEKANGEFLAPVGSRWTRNTRFAVIADRFLRPIRADGITDKEVTDLYTSKPNEVETVITAPKELA